jgi:hypothetical protein
MKKVASLFLALVLVVTLSAAGMLSGCAGEEEPAAPTITSVNPASARMGEALDVAITGTNLTDASAVNFGSGITVSSFTADSDTRITASIAVAAGATVGSRDVSVTGPGGTGTKTGGFAVASPLAPSVTGISPESGGKGEGHIVTISGSNFIDVSDVSLGSGVTVNYFNADSETQLSAGIAIAGDAELGARDVSVTNSAGTATGGGIFTITWPAALQAIIEGAAEEGEVRMKHSSLITEDGVERLEAEILEMFGVDLDIQNTPTGGRGADIAEAMMELETGVTPSYDMHRFGPDHAFIGLEVGLFAEVDWAPLIIEGTVPDVLLSGDMERFMVIDTDFDAIVYNPDVISAEEAPTSFYDLADPKWKDTIGIAKYESWWGLTVFCLGGEEGKDENLDLIRDILDNGAIQGRWSELLSRYLIGEVDIFTASVKYFMEAVNQGVPAEWSTLDFVLVDPGLACVREGAPNPNAAKLLSIFLASPEGSVWSTEESGAGNMFYGVGPQTAIIEEAVADGVPIRSRTDADVAEYITGPLYDEWSEEILEILQTG